MGMKFLELKQERAEAMKLSDGIIARAETGKRAFTTEEQTLLDTNLGIIQSLNKEIDKIAESNTLVAGVHGAPKGMFLEPGSGRSGSRASATTFSAEEHPQAAAFRGQFAGWMNNVLTSIGGGAPQMEATAPTGVVSIGTGTGLDSIGITVPTEVLQYLPSYFALDSFGLAGATQFFTDHTRPLVKPILSAGAADAVFAENAAPGTSQPFGVSGFTFGGVKYARLVLATYESLMNSELPLQGAILDELMATLANTLTTATTALMNTALTGASSTLEVGTGGSNDIYSSLIDLRHAVPPRFDLPGNKWMLSRATLATIRNKRASTSGVAMFDPNSDTIFGKPYVVNDNFDSICGAGFVVYGNWANGAYLRRTPVVTQVFLEAYAASGNLGFRTQQWADAQFLASLAGSGTAAIVPAALLHLHRDGELERKCAG